MVQFEVFEKQQQDCRDGLYDDLLVSIDIYTKFHALQHCGPAEADRGNEKLFKKPHSKNLGQVRSVKLQSLLFRVNLKTH